MSRTIDLPKRICYPGEMLEIKVRMDKGAKLPTKAHNHDAGWDLYARKVEKVDAEMLVVPQLNYGSAPFNRMVPRPPVLYTIDTGVHIAIPEGWMGVVYGRSGLAFNQAVFPAYEGIIDAGYTGSIKVLLRDDKYQHEVMPGDKVAQLVFLPVPEITLRQVTKLTKSKRGKKGFGSSGT